MQLPFPLPSLASSSEQPIWTGSGFRIGNTLESVLCYSVDNSGWTDQLSDFHESIDGDQHYIAVASRRNAVSRVAKWVKRRNPVVMDVGCNSGYLLRDLKQAFPESCLVGADYVADPLRKLARRLPDVPLLQFDLTTCPLPDECVDAAVLLNVLEHIEDHEAAARQLHRILRKGGVAIIEVPAGPDLYDIYDRQLMHFRRYSSNGLGNLLEKAGFEVRDRSHLGFFLYPPFALVKLRNKRHLSLPDREQMKIAAQHMTMARQNPLLNWVMSAEERIRYRIPLPFGIRCVAVGVKV